ncbi:hypothetical protein [Halocatena marina]|uniref:Uncharacterized protein n=1 Tax=Halocatena marina TaxID=2934937 RepID=A0ABD5YR27_9EURY|nr:hypothetical protein [Halocatena marina]
MMDPAQWSSEKKETRLQQMFEEAQQRIGDGPGFMNVTFEGDIPMYQYRSGCHTVTKVDDRKDAAMLNVSERHGLEIPANYTDPDFPNSMVLRVLYWAVDRLFSLKQPSSDVECVMACHSQPVNASDEYIIFEDICKIVYGCTVDTVSDVTIHVTDIGIFSDDEEVISWTEV